MSYFFLRASQVARRAGFLATNTISQGDTREVGLDRLIEDGWMVTHAFKSAPWPGDASLEIAKVWYQRWPWLATAVLEGSGVERISSSLEPVGRVTGAPRPLPYEKKLSFIGSFVNGIGFVLDEAEAQRLIAANSRNREVLFPYLTGEDLNSRPDGSASRWVINFFDWPLSKAEAYPACLRIVRERVKPHRDQVNRKAHRDYWWHYGDKRQQLYESIRSLDRVIAISCVSKAVQPMFASVGQVFAHRLAIFAYDDHFYFGLLTSGFHWSWAVRWASTLETRINYTPSDCFETFPQCGFSEDVASAGKALDEHRRGVMLTRQEGLTKTYNRIHDPDEHADDITHLRELHTTLDHAVAQAYGWYDLPLDHDFHPTTQGTRYTFSPTTRTEILDRLLELNQDRYEDEVGLRKRDLVVPFEGRHTEPQGSLLEGREWREI